MLPLQCGLSLPLLSPRDISAEECDPEVRLPSLAP